MERFAKVFETRERGQIVVFLQGGEEGPEIRFFVKPDGLGVSSVAMQWKSDDEKSWEQAENDFESIDADKAIAATNVIFELASPLKN